MIPLHADLVAEISPWLTPKPIGERVWLGNWAKDKKAGYILRFDLATARKAWIEEAGDDQDEGKVREASSFLAYRDRNGRVADFHALRHTFITRLVKAGVKPKEAQTLARHSTITLTMDRYAHSGLNDIAAAVESLPSLNRKPVGRDNPRHDPTSGSHKEAGNSGCTMVAQTTVRSRLQPASEGIERKKRDGEEDDQETPQAVDPSALGISSHQQEAEGEGFEPSDGFHRLRFSRPVQSAALPPLRSAAPILPKIFYSAIPANRRRCRLRTGDRDIAYGTHPTPAATPVTLRRRRTLLRENERLAG